MELAEIFVALRRRRLLMVIVVLAAIGAAVAVKETSHSIPTGAATAQLLVDSPQSALADLQQDTAPLATRASVYAQLMTSGAVLEAIAKTAGIPPTEVTAAGPYTGAGEVLDVPTPSEARGAQIVAAKPTYRLSFVAQTDLPLITVSAQAPTPAAAGNLADSVVLGTSSWLAALQASGKVPSDHRVTLRQLGDAQASVVNASSATALAGVAAMAILMLGLLAIVAIDLSLGRRARSRAAAPAMTSSSDADPFGSPDAAFDLERLGEVPAGFDLREFVG